MHPPLTSAATHALRRQRRTALTSIAAAVLLVGIKLGAGVQSGSLGLLAEAIHSAADLIAAVLTYIAIRVGQRPPDRRHPFGHGRAEHLAALGESIILLAATLYIGVEATRRLGRGSAEIEVHAWLIAVTLGVIAIDVWRTIASRRAAAESHSPAFASNALHFASDLAGSVAVLIGLLLVRAGFQQGDALAALIVAAIVATSAWRLFWDNAQVLMDVAPEAAERTATRAVTSLDLPITLQRLRIRRSAGAYLADIVIGVAATDHVSQGHALADEVEAAVEAVLPGSDVVVHVEPDEQGGSIRDRVTAAALAHAGIHEVHNVRVLLLDGTPEVSMHIKVRGDMRLDGAHDLADRVEQSVRQAVPGVSHVDVHIEPMQHVAFVAGAVSDEDLLSRARASVQQACGAAPVDLRLRRSAQGLVAYVVVHAPAEVSIDEAHALATRVEEQIHRDAPEIDDVVVHTEPDQSLG